MTIFDKIKSMTPDELYNYMYDVCNNSSFEKPQCKFCKVSYSPKCNMQWCQTAFRDMCNIKIFRTE